MHDSLLEPFGGQLLVACSGGADSVALAHLAATRAKRLGLPAPRLGHVNHGLRDESDEEGRILGNFAQQLGTQALIEKIDLDPNGGGLEARARDARYAALGRMALACSADWVLLGHTQSDQAETIFMRIVRGTGVFGLAGMAAKRGHFGRPLLGVSRRETEHYCRQHDLSYVEDPMNRDQRFTRVRIRHSWIPKLESENPKIRQALCGLADSARDHRDVLEWAAARAQSELGSGGGLQLGREFNALPESLAKRVLARFAETRGRPLERKHLEALYDLCHTPTSGTRSLDLPAGTIVRQYDELSWGSDESVREFIAPPGFRLRRWQHGDRMRPERLKGRSRKLSDLYADAKIPAKLRPEAWLAVRAEDGADEEIVWAQYIGDAFGWSVAIKEHFSDAQVPE